MGGGKVPGHPLQARGPPSHPGLPACPGVHRPLWLSFLGPPEGAFRVASCRPAVDSKHREVKVLLRPLQTVVCSGRGEILDGGGSLMASSDLSLPSCVPDAWSASLCETGGKGPTLWVMAPWKLPGVMTLGQVMITTCPFPELQQWLQLQNVLSLREPQSS